ncbi:MAG: putative L,D-transpeptidase YkuD [Pseudomonadota bacterium]
MATDLLSLLVSLKNQTLSVLYRDADPIHYPISSGLNGAGETRGSEKTPRGWHIIRAKIGAGKPANTVFVGRRPTGELYSDALAQQYPGRDWILTRILWLSGLELGKNRLGTVDTMQRYIYIHGTPDDTQLGQPGSRGCIRMRNRDLITLFDEVSVGTRLLITTE